MEFQNLFYLSINNFKSPRNAVKLIGKTYGSSHLKHFSKYEAAISECAQLLKVCMLGSSVHNIVPFEQNT